MSELRYDPLQRRWVIIASARGKRPHDFKVKRSERGDSEHCPFCAGHEDWTPPEIMSIRDGEGANTPWRIRVTANKFPALSPDEGDPVETADGLYMRHNGVGAHEVIIEGQDHDLTLPDFDLSLTTELMRTYQARLSALLDDPRFKYVLIFKNHGATAGASLSHPHSQIIATPITPRTVQIELLATRTHFEQQGSCLICDMIQQEIDTGSRMVYRDDLIIAFNSYASRFPFELFIAPLDHSAHFETSPEATMQALAKCLKTVLGGLRSTLDDPPFNYILHTAPNTVSEPKFNGYWETLDRDYHWHIEVIPRLTLTAGFEWGSGLHINPMPPEQAAEFLRNSIT